MPCIVTIYRGTSFKSACDTHDICYSNCEKSKLECDVSFFDDMMKACVAAFPTKEGEEDEVNIEFHECARMAIAYFGAVVVSEEGKKAYATRQNLNCECACPPKKEKDKESPKNSEWQD